MTELVTETKKDGKWIEVGVIRDGDPTGSVSSTGLDGSRQVYMFGHFENEWGVWRSLAGADEEIGHVRIIGSLGFEKITDLAKPYEAFLLRPAGTFVVRWSLR